MIGTSEKNLVPNRAIIIPYPLYSPNYTLWRACSLLRFALHLPPVCHLIVYSLGQLISNHSLRDKTASTLLLHCAVRTTRIQCSSFLCFFFLRKGPFYTFEPLQKYNFQCSTTNNMAVQLLKPAKFDPLKCFFFILWKLKIFKFKLKKFISKSFKLENYKISVSISLKCRLSIDTLLVSYSDIFFSCS